MSYKIKILCTQLNDLSFNEYKINEKLTNKINELLKPEETDFIDNIIVLYKKNDSIIIKSLEFFCNREITKKELEDYLIDMYNCGFKSKNDVNVDLINTKTNDILLRIGYDTFIHKKIKPYTKQKNNSSYTIHKIYNKK